MASPRLTVIGSFMQASCWQLPRLPDRGESLAAAGFWQAPAGKGLAVGLGCHRLGARVELLLALGRDAAGEALMARLEGEGLSTRHVRRCPGPSGQGAGWLAADGQNAIAIFQGANARLDAAHVARCDEAFAASALVYAQFETPPEAALAAFGRARREGACTVLNPSPWQMPDAALLAATQVLLVNAAEVLGLLPGFVAPAQGGRQACAASAMPLWRAWPGDARRRLVVTLGGEGCVALSPDGGCHPAAAPAVQALSSIGAGDAFAAGLCTALAEGLPMDAALARANACGAFAATRAGILEGLPTAAELAAFRSPT